ncbi:MULTISPECIES: restriction endonuclease subunit S [Microcystis]|uniref:restriction endonuclease subunit S n=1 Tax=Microcystis TaxID=1125 RepID=UPI00168112E5|nr:restriction endonuclease subunit S [Microcystis wesenbergii]MBD2118336.1 restriction endonuclease subunit S [Microcystis wesenbergii FACHB-1339]
MKLNKKYIALNNLIILQRGFDLPEIERVIGNIPVVASTGIIGSHNIAKVKGPGVVIGRSGSIGGGQYVAGDFWPLNTTLWVKDFKEHNPRFIYYVLKNIDFSRFNFGTGVPTLNRNHIANIKVLAFDKSQEEKIADILSKYDDLIENNRRRIELLERSARLLYKEWFVRLRFPGHEHTPIIDGIPEGWERLKLSDLCEVKRGASPRPINNYMGGTVPWFKIGDATKSESPFIFETVELVTEDGARQSVFLEPLSLILSNSATCGIPFFTGLHGCIHDGWLCFKNFQGISKYFLYCYLLFKQRELLQSVGDGSTQKNLNTKIVEKLDIIIPNNGVILKLFDNFVNPAFTMILTLAIQNMKLRKARDILLPKLMNGEIEV